MRFGKFANEGKTYREVYVDDEMAGYCKWSMNHLGNKSTSPIARDWYSFLCACKVVEDSGKVGKQRVASLELQCRGSWVIERILIGAKARKDYELGCSLDGGQRDNSYYMY